MEKLYALSPLDGRYYLKVDDLRKYFSELALINYRIVVECEYFIFLNSYLSAKKNKVRKLTESEIKKIRSIYNNKDRNALEVKKIEFSGDEAIKPTNHDVKAVEYYIKKILSREINNNLELIHFGLTSEDINNIAYSIMISSFVRDIYLKEIKKLLDILFSFSIKYADSIFPARTHGQIASPTTFGKEIRIFYQRLKNQFEMIKKHHLKVKLNGAVGNYNAFVSAYPDIDWIDFSVKFIEHINKFLNLSLKPNLYTTQIENHDSWIELFDRSRHINNILIGLSQDIWNYISDDLIVLKPVEGEVGSSTMPHKVNPINFENAEGNFQIANALFEFFSSKFAISRMQRDLSNSTVERNISVAFGHTIIAIRSLMEGFGKISLNHRIAREVVLKHPEVYAEAIQTILRKYAIKGGYEMLKKITRGNKINRRKLIDFITRLNLSPEIENEIKEVISRDYIGLAPRLAKMEE